MRWEWDEGSVMWDVGCGMWDVGCRDVGCGMWDVGMWDGGMLDVGCGMWDVGCGMWGSHVIAYNTQIILDKALSVPNFKFVASFMTEI